MAYEITGHTVLTGLLGSPVAHSISPMMHNEAFRQLELDYAYLAFDVGTDNLKTAVDGLKVMGVRGFNLTMPDKNLMCSLVDKPSAAILIQAALDKVAEISVFNIRDEFFTRAEKTIEKLHEKTDCKINLYDFSDPEVLKKEIAESAILVNGTSIGMAPKTDRCIITDDSVFRKDLFVFDVIYNPEETLFLKKAKAAGCRTLNGLNMLLYQGAASFELWTGKEMPVDIIKEKYFSR